MQANKPAYLSAAGVKNLARKSRVQDRDDELGFIVQCIIDSDLTTKQIAEAALKAGHNVHAATMENWLKPDGVRSPQNRTVNAVMAGLGYVKSWTRRPLKPRTH
jgi:hypothetical protein